MNILYFLFLSKFWFELAVALFFGGIIYGIVFVYKHSAFNNYKRFSKVLGILFVGLFFPVMIILFTLMIRLLDYLVGLVW